MAFFIEDLLAVGGFDTRLGAGALGGSARVELVGDDFEVQDRMLLQGLRPVHVPEAVVRHWVPRDRCSPDWVLERAYRQASSRALVREDLPEEALFLGLPPWAYQQALALWLWAAAACLGRNERLLFRRRVAYHAWLGTMAGLRAAYAARRSIG
jgi:hypothetical protein